MDYKYIEQLMERYWNAETSLEEESILRTFFSQKDIPAEMEHLRPLFVDEAVGETLDDDFDARIMQAIGMEADKSLTTEHEVKAREVSLTQRLMPLFKVNKITLFGAIYLSIIAVTPYLLSHWSNVAKTSGVSLGGTSIIIVVGVALETVQALENQMLMRHYKGFLE